MSSARMATVTVVIFIVALVRVLYGLAEIKADPQVGDCSSEVKVTKEVNVSQPNTTVTLKCKDAGQVKPPFENPDFKVCTEKDCSDEQPLSDYIDGATVKEVSDATAEIEIKNLPSNTKTFYIQCGTTTLDSCYIQVKVAGAPSKPGDVTTGGPQSCATPGGAITIEIPEKGSTAHFTCGEWTLYPRATDRVFAEDCKKEESLKDIVRSVNDDVYTLTAGKKPPKRKWCYLCASSDVTSNAPGKPSDYCVVRVESSSRTQPSTAIALAAMIPCVLAMLRTT